MAIGDKKSAVMQSDIVNDFTTGGAKNVLSAEMGKTLAQRPNPNLLDNWYFANPIDQRGGYVVPPGVNYYGADLTNVAGTTTSYLTARIYAAIPTQAYIYVGSDLYYVQLSDCVRGYTGEGYTIDRWKFMDSAGDCVALITNNGVQVSIGSGNGHFCQEIETVIPEDAVITISALVNGELFTISGVGGIEGDLISGATFYYNKTYKRFGIWLPANSPAITIKAAKLELGDTQTLAYQENGVWVLNEIPNYAEQLLRCSQSTADVNDTHANGRTGFAPAGFGYGNIADTYSITSADQIITVLSSIYSKLPDKTKRTVIFYFTYSKPETISGGQWFVEIHRNDVNYGFAKALQYDIYTVNEMSCTYWNGTWGNWEWINPKMALNTEYRTTERYRGKPVYAMAVNFGNLPVDTYKITAHNIANVDCMLSACGVIPERGTQIPGKSLSNGYWNNDIDVFADRSNMQVVTRNSNDGLKNEGWTAQITLRYTKTTD